MFEGLKKFRELAAWAVVGAIALSLLLSLIEVPLRAGRDAFGSFPMAAFYSTSLVSVLSSVVLTVLVILCLLWERTPNARILTLLSMILIGGGVVVSLLFQLVGLAADVEPWDKVSGFFQALAGWVIPALCAFVLFQLFQGLPAPAPAQGAQGAGQFGQPQVGPGGQYAQGQGQYGQDQYGQEQYGQSSQFGQQPTWQPDQASGASWNTAGQAASGASASDWGQPGAPGGWDAGQQSATHQDSADFQGSAGFQDSAGVQDSASHQQSAAGWGSASHQQSAPHPGEGQQYEQSQQQYDPNQQYGEGQQYGQGQQQYGQTWGDHAQQYDPNQQYGQGQQYDPNQQYGQGQQYDPNQQYGQGQYDPNQQYGQGQYAPNQQYGQQGDGGTDEGETQWRPAPPNQ